MLIFDVNAVSVPMMIQRRDLLILFAIALISRGLAMVPVQHPGYMDAAYSYDVALNLARGQGLAEPFLWNYLDDPAGLPHPSHLYWMPLPTLLAWIGIALFGQTYRAAQIPFILVSALLPLVSYWVALQTTGRRFYGWIAGLLTIFSGFYVVYWGHTDNFAPFALAGSLCLLAGWQAADNGMQRARGPFGFAIHCPTAGLQTRRGRERGIRRGWHFCWALAAGMLAGLAHLSRADGVLLLAVVAVLLAVSLRQATAQWTGRSARRVAVGLMCLILGYCLIMLPWFVRNWMVAGAPMPAMGMQAIWLTTYDDLFSYGRELSLHTYLAWGWNNILHSKLQALWLNTQTVVAVLAMVFLAPLAPIGAWRLRAHGLYRLAGYYAALLFAVMTLIFTFPGPRGGLFHSAGALLPFTYAAALVGLDVAIEWMASRRPAWNPSTAGQVFGCGLVGLAVLVTAVVTYRGVIAAARWRQPDLAYTQLALWLESHGQADDLIMVGDPPDYWYTTGRPSIVVPNEPLETTLEVARRYGATYLVLDSNTPLPLRSLYRGEQRDPRLELVQDLPGDTCIYRISCCPTNERETR